MLTTTPTELESAAMDWTQRLSRDADEVARRIKLVCPERSRIRTADEMRRISRSMMLAAEHIAATAETLEANHAS